MLGGFSPYRLGPLPDYCFECGSPKSHFAHECPTRFIRVRGEPPPCFRNDGFGKAVRDEVAWNGSELTDASRAQYRQFLAKFLLLPHITHPITVDEITGLVPVPVRRPLVPDGGRRP